MRERTMPVRASGGNTGRRANVLPRASAPLARAVSAGTTRAANVLTCRCRPAYLEGRAGAAQQTPYGLLFRKRLERLRFDVFQVTANGEPGTGEAEQAGK